MDPIRPIDPNEPRFQIQPALPVRRVVSDDRRPHDQDEDADAGRPYDDPDYDDPDGEDPDAQEWDAKRQLRPRGVADPPSELEPFPESVELDVYDDHGHLAIHTPLDLGAGGGTTPGPGSPAADRTAAPSSAQTGVDRRDDDAGPPIHHIDISA